MNKGLFKLGTRELDCAELPAQNGIVQSWVPYITVYIFAQFRPVRRHWKRSVAEDTKLLCLGAKEKMWTRYHVRCGHWHPARILSVGI